ncbi:Phage repressor [Desulfosporosinus sp. I2]|uniref:helix-turn-helix domain-containing protein n=1 Tax=unclassified Desulfosporosinus TaxID=2633794 RepID=UPI00061E8895|nr:MULTISPECIES: helix-turn-helix domain-containing protein [unclassified Desulfosporosinus]KJR47390.1 Phage repressor [Desulfosporosinus sp. I2]ODA40136.1 Phage repressor [Desulfosporosinus sp. BG]
MGTLGDRLKKLRQERTDKPRQEDVAVATGYSRATYANWEIGRGEPDHNALRALSKYFNCTTDYLLGLSDQHRPSPPKNNEKDEEIELNFRIAANNEDGYGQEPSPELKRFVQEIIKEELYKVRKK